MAGTLASAAQLCPCCHPDRDPIVGTCTDCLPREWTVIGLTQHNWPHPAILLSSFLSSTGFLTFLFQLAPKQLHLHPLLVENELDRVIEICRVYFPNQASPSIKKEAWLHFIENLFVFCIFFNKISLIFPLTIHLLIALILIIDEQSHLSATPYNTQPQRPTHTNQRMKANSWIEDEHWLTLPNSVIYLSFTHC